MTEYMTRPHKVEAMMFDGRNARAVLRFIDESGAVTKVNGHDVIDVFTNGAMYRICKGDYAVKDLGLLSMCKGKDFERLYEPIESAKEWHNDEEFDV